MNTNMLHKALEKEQERIRQLIEQYESCGPSGEFAADIMKRALQQSAQSIASGETCQIITAYERLKGFIK